jgi:hypothetical protein
MNLGSGAATRELPAAELRVSRVMTKSVGEPPAQIKAKKKAI